MTSADSRFGEVTMNKDITISREAMALLQPLVGTKVKKVKYGYKKSPRKSSRTCRVYYVNL